jgi:CRP-like cAMP-binding protein
MAPWIKAGQTVALKVDAYQDRTFEGKVSRISPGVNTSTRAFPFEALVGNPETVLKPGACFGEMAVFDRSERSTDAIANTDCTLLTITRSDFEILLAFNRDISYKVLWAVVRLLSERLRVTNDNLRSFLAMSMF